MSTHSSLPARAAQQETEQAASELPVPGGMQRETQQHGGGTLPRQRGHSGSQPSRLTPELCGRGSFPPSVGPGVPVGDGEDTAGLSVYGPLLTVLAPDGRTAVLCQEMLGGIGVPAS